MIGIKSSSPPLQFGLIGVGLSKAVSKRHAAVGLNLGMSNCFLGKVGLSWSDMSPPL